MATYTAITIILFMALYMYNEKNARREDFFKLETK